MTGPVAILGASSLIAKDFVLEAARHGTQNFHLFARTPEKVNAFLADHRLNLPVFSLDDFGKADYSAILHFIGIGDPAKAKAMGAAIFDATLRSDCMAMDYLESHADTRYIFMSSGAVYGTDYNAPVNEASTAQTPLNAFQPQHYYSAAKLYAEARHRAMHGKTIFDIRIFNYISRTMDLSARLLITDMINAIKSNSVFRTDDQEMTRDFLHPADFHRLIEACLSAPQGTNMPLDAYSKAPISKTSLLAAMKKEFGLKTERVPVVDAIHATGRKPRYYSENRRAAQLGYEPAYTSLEGILKEVSAILAR